MRRENPKREKTKQHLAPEYKTELEAKRLLDEISFIFDSTHDAISLVEYSNNEFRYLGNNIVHKKITGFDTIKGMSPVEILGDDIGNKLTKYYEQCIETRSFVSYVQTFDFGSGDRIWQTDVTPIYLGDGVGYLFCSSKDITEIKVIESEKEMLSKVFQSMFENHDAVILIIDTHTMKIFDANPSACRFYGYKRDELKEMTINDIMISIKDIEDYYQSTFEEIHNSHVYHHKLKNGDKRIVDVYSSHILVGEKSLLYSIIFDVTDREYYKNRLFHEKEILRTTLKSIGDGVVTTDVNGYIISLNSVAEEISGWKEGDAFNKYFTDVFNILNEETGRQADNPVKKVLETFSIVELNNQTLLINRHGKMLPIIFSAAPIKSEKGKVLGVVVVFRDISDVKEHINQIEYLSYHDSLTGLYNRRYVDEMIKYVDLEENLPITIVMGDVNGLKITNDVFGHAKGDLLLKEMAKTLKSYFRKTDIIARWGGDEVIIIMPRTKPDVAEEIVEKINSTNILIDQSGLYLSISLGIFTKKSVDEDIQFIMQMCEEDMYHKKLLDGKSYRNSIINSLLATVYEKSYETVAHSSRIEYYCNQIAKTLNLSLKEMEELSLLAKLHDIGYVSVNTDILTKDTSLTLDEWQDIKKHAEIGYRIAKAIPELAIIADYILYHHERYDGKGYPRGLKEDEIPMTCRIFSIVDAFDSMVQERKYRPSISTKNAIHEIKLNAGYQFDPEIVEVFTKLISCN